MNLYLCRHGQALFNTRRELRATSEDGLTSLGVQQSHLLGKLLESRSIGRVISSSQNRAIETAQIISSYLRCNVDVNDDLRERNYGSFEGMHLEDLRRLRDDLKHTYLDVTLDWDENQGVETNPEAFRRAFSVICSIPDDCNVALITHAGVIFSILDGLFAFGAQRVCTVKIAPGILISLEKRVQDWLLHEVISPIMIYTE